MANDYLNTLSVVGHPSDVDAFVASAAKDGVPFSFEALLPPPDGIAGPERERWERENWGAPAPWEGMEPARTSEWRPGLSTAGFAFVTRGLSPFRLAENLARVHPGVVFVMASVEPAMEVAEIRVLRGDDSWTYELHETEIAECVAEGEEFPDEEAMLDALAVSADSVLDDWSHEIPTSPSP